MIKQGRGGFLLFTLWAFLAAFRALGGEQTKCNLILSYLAEIYDSTDFSLHLIADHEDDLGGDTLSRLLGYLAEAIPVNFPPAAMLMAIPPYFFSRRETSAISQWQIAFSMTAERNR